MTEISALKKATSKRGGGKGELPDRNSPRVAAVTAGDTRRSEKGAKMPLQLRVDEEMFEAFSAEAAKMFGYKRGAKSQYFEYLFNNRR